MCRFSLAYAFFALEPPTSLDKEKGCFSADPLIALKKTPENDPNFVTWHVKQETVSGAIEGLMAAGVFVQLPIAPFELWAVTTMYLSCVCSQKADLPWLADAVAPSG
jgi:hypothetical protein